MTTTPECISSLVSLLNQAAPEPNFFECLQDARALRRIAMTLHRWYELECGITTPNGRGVYVARPGPDDRPYLFWDGSDSPEPTPDREKGALRRLDSIMARYPGLAYYLQTDPRGAPLYIYRKADLPPDRPIYTIYSSIGVAVYK